jgi:hypothetical protein
VGLTFQLRARAWSGCSGFASRRSNDGAVGRSRYRHWRHGVIDAGQWTQHGVHITCAPSCGLRSVSPCTARQDQPNNGYASSADLSQLRHCWQHRRAWICMPQAPPVSGHSFASLSLLTGTIRSGTPATLPSSSLLTLRGHFRL